jgi:YD repeat-containing protein
MRREDEDIRWIREDFTYDANNNVTRVVSYDGQGFKKVTDYEYDASQNVTRKTSRFEKA